MKLLFIYASFVIVTVYVPPALFPIGYAIFGFPSPKYWYLPYPTAYVLLPYYSPKLNRNTHFNAFYEHVVLFYLAVESVPFDIKQPFGFYAVFTVQCLSGMSYMLFVSIFSGFYLGMCSYIDVCVMDLTTFVNDLNQATAVKNPLEKQSKIHELSSGLLQFHVDTLK